MKQNITGARRGNFAVVYLCVLSVLLCFPLPGGAQAVSTTAVPLVSSLPLDDASKAELDRAIRQRQYVRAENILVDAAKARPQAGDVLAEAGRVFFLDGKYLNSAIAFQKASAIAPLQLADRFTLAMAYVTLGQREWARNEITALAAADTRNDLYPYWLGKLDYDDMRYDSAISHLNLALKLNAEYTRAWDQLGLCYEAVGQYDRAIESYQTAVTLNQRPSPNAASLDSHSPWPPMNLAALLIKSGQLSDAEPLLRESLSFAPDFPKAHYQLGLLYEKRHQDQPAVAELRRAAELDPSMPEPYYILGRIYQRLGQTQQAAQAWATFQKLSSKREASK